MRGSVAAVTVDRRSETLWRAISIVELAVGIGFAAAPARLSRLYGLPADGMTGTAALGWRLFAARNLVVGAASLQGSAAARQALLPVQVLDQAVFLHALITRSVPPRAALLAMATSGGLIATSVAASRLEQRER